MTDVHTRAEIEGDRRGGMALEHQREAKTLELMENKPGFDIALISDADFEAGLDRIKVRQRRMQRIIESILVPEVHYMTKDRDGKVIFDRPHLTIAGASELRNQFRLTCRPIEAPAVTILPGYVNVAVTVGCYDSVGRLLGSRAGACNTLERRFRRRGNQKGFTYDDPREMVHQCLAMAEKRGAKLITAEVTGAVAFFANEDAMEEALEEATPKEEVKQQPWTAEERERVLKAARDGGIKSGPFLSMVREVLGHDHLGQIATGTEVEQLLRAIADTKRARTTPVNTEGYDAEQAEQDRSAQDEEFEKRLAGE